VVVVLLLATACGTRSEQARISSSAKITIVEPTSGTVVTADSVRVRVRLEGARIIPDTRFDLTPDEGHIHLSLNGNVLGMWYGLDEIIPVGKGPQLLQAEFVAADHLPFNPRVISTVTFTVR
jgi:hypothetical protein